MFGFYGRILTVNLTDESFKIDTLPEEIYGQVLGGKGLWPRVIREGLKPEHDRLPQRLHREPLPSGQQLTEEQFAPVFGRTTADILAALFPSLAPERYHSGGR